MNSDYKKKIVIGLTGNIASGKSLVSNTLKELGAFIIDVDYIGKEVLSNNTEGALLKVLKEFGPSILNPDGTLNRRKLGNIVFTSSSNLKKLNEIMIPIITRILEERIKKTLKKHDIVVVDAAILIEAGWDSLVEEVWVVTTTKEKQLERLVKRDNYEESEAEARISAQMSQKEKVKKAARVIDNSLSITNTKKQVEESFKSVVKKIKNG